MGLLSLLMGLGCESIDTKELKEKRSRKEDFFLLDVRTPAEYQKGRIDGAKLIPLHELDSRVKEVPKHKEVVVYCASGVRSAFACRKLKSLGFEHVKNLSGGINRW
ncbi:MAG: rhodanese-like domain-containing protein [Nitrospirota bacterium]